MAIMERKYLYNISTFRAYGVGGEIVKHKFTRLSCMRNAGIEDEEEYKKRAENRGLINDEKLDNNISRARNKIFEYATCNLWEYFVTLTIDKEKYNRENLQKWYKDFSQWIQNQNKKHGYNIKYLLIPELHSDGESWHAHGLLYNIPDSMLHQFQIGDIMSTYIADKVKKDEVLYNWWPYSDKFGFCLLEPVRSIERCASYITKYITKDLERSVTDLNAHLYYCSRGLEGSQLVIKGHSDFEFTPDYEGEYSACKWFPHLVDKPSIYEQIMASFA